MFVAESLKKSKQRFGELEFEYFGGSDVTNRLFMSVSPSAERKKEFLEDLRLGRDSKDSKASIQARNDGDDELAIEIEAKRLLRKYRVS